MMEANFLILPQNFNFHQFWRTVFQHKTVNFMISWQTSVVMPIFPVFLNVYDMHWTNEYTSKIGMGIYHSAVEVHGREFAFVGHEFASTGLVDLEPKSITSLGMESFKFRESIYLGETDLNKDDIRAIIQDMGVDFTGLSYHLVTRNCNHFSSEFAKLLCGKDIPAWINRIANLGSRLPWIYNCLPKEWLTPEPEDPNMLVQLPPASN
ncbi:deubiquitinase DESI2-like [Xenia sp. Carnegie-2017]|uniref:deubiquitinase DESI2-like n=1 Tax=Xenia sp. Carnegie-2017 TaxID=2897299 RepID=UPI001F0504AF|nr:deubiquitinase DESI2-like [Xenia sp. Carnegie-2017]